MSSQPTEIDRHSRIELDTNYVMVAAVGRGWSAGLDGCDIRGPADDRFGKQETCGEFRVVARRPHRDRNASSLAPSGVEKPRRISRGSSTATLSARVSRKPSLIRATSIARLRWDMIVPGLTTGLASI